MSVRAFGDLLVDSIFGPIFDQNEKGILQTPGFCSRSITSPDGSASILGYGSTLANARWSSAEKSALSFIRSSSRPIEKIGIDVCTSDRGHITLNDQTLKLTEEEDSYDSYEGTLLGGLCHDRTDAVNTLLPAMLSIQLAALKEFVEVADFRFYLSFLPLDIVNSISAHLKKMETLSFLIEGSGIKECFITRFTFSDCIVVGSSFISIEDSIKSSMSNILYLLRLYSASGRVRDESEGEVFSYSSSSFIILDSCLPDFSLERCKLNMFRYSLGSVFDSWNLYPYFVFLPLCRP